MEICLENVRPTRTGRYRLLPNINRSDRDLPPDVSVQEIASNTKVDVEKPSRKFSDREIYSLRISISEAEWAANPNLFLEATFDVKLFQILTQSAVPLPGQDTSPIKIPLKDARSASTKARGIQFFLEARTFWGSPLVSEDSSPTASFRILDAAGRDLLAERCWNGSDPRTADIILVGDHAPPERLFLCELDENQPSVREVSEAAKAAGVPLTLVPLDVAGGDSWLQDQFQLGYTATPEGDQRVIVHLPRMRSDSALHAGTPNLRNFADTYFPSKTVGVLKDFWRPTLTLSDGSVSQDFTVAQSYVIHKRLNLIPRLLGQVISLALTFNNPTDKVGARIALEALQADTNDIFAIRNTIDVLKAKLLADTTLKPEQRKQVLNIKAALDAFSSFAELQGNTLVVKVTIDKDEKAFSFTQSNSAQLRAFFKAATNLHSSQNYGGNIEVSPPFGDASYGKILAGSVTSPELKRFLTSRGTLHPLVQVNTEWLGVGHIDEIAAFAPLPSSGFCVLRASPRLALEMLRKLVALQEGGTLVTRLLRGKKWIDESSTGSTDALPAPAAYKRLLESGRYDLSALAKAIPYTPNPGFVDAAFHDDRQFLVRNNMVNRSARYAAMISCVDLLAVCTTANRAAEDLFLANTYAYADDISYRDYYDLDYYKKEVLPMRLDKVLQDQFPGIHIYPLPVLFDYVPNYLRAQTSAIVPAAVNFQTLGNHLLVPRPYGPRLPVTAAAGFVAGVVASLGFPKTTIDERFIRSRELDKTWHWTGPKERVNRASMGNMPTDFDPDYEEMKRAKNLAIFAPDLGSAGAALAPLQMLDTYTIEHGRDPLKNHPVSEPETLYRIAGYFKDGFEPFKNYPVDYCKGDTDESHPKADQYDKDLQDVMTKIRDANPGVFDDQGNLVVKDWMRIAIPEDTADVFEVYTTALMEGLGLQVHWVDSWYYHTHLGGIHCGTNVLRSSR